MRSVQQNCHIVCASYRRRHGCRNGDALLTLAYSFHLVDQMAAVMVMCRLHMPTIGLSVNPSSDALLTLAL